MEDLGREAMSLLLEILNRSDALHASGSCRRTRSARLDRACAPLEAR
jgi:hypothetical protein